LLACTAVSFCPLSAFAQEPRVAPPASDPAPGAFQVSMFVDAYAAWQTSGEGTLATLSGHRAFSGQGATLRAENGFGLSFLGLDASYDVGSVGVVANLRFGQAAAIYHRHSEPESDATFGVEYLTQAYALCRPVKQLELDLGMFTSPFGTESLESFRNPNYTISALYVYGQPSWHLGAKATWQVDETVALMAMLVNGSNNASETQQGAGLDQSPTLGGSIKYAPHSTVSFGLGGLLATDGVHNDDGGVDAFVDLVAHLELGSLTALLNADFILTRDAAPSTGDRHFWGGSLTAGYRLTSMVGVAGRAEYLQDDANYGGGDRWRLVTGTVTLDVKPLDRAPYLILRWDNRWERSNQRIFGKDSRGTADTQDDSYRRTWFETVVGVVVTTAS
jgi:hypothetical protein